MLTNTDIKLVAHMILLHFNFMEWEDLSPPPPPLDRKKNSHPKQNVFCCCKEVHSTLIP